MPNLTKKRFTSFIGDEELAEQLKCFPCRYNKSAKSYKEKTCGEKCVGRSGSKSRICERW